MTSGEGALRGLKGLDHVLVGVSDLEAARANWERLGFTACPRGRHIGWGTANYCLMLERDYIELIGIVDPTQFTNNLDVFLEGGEGLLGLAYASGDMAETAAALAERAIPADGPKDLKRILELPEGEVRPAFELLFPEAEALPGARAFICRHLTPEIVWREEWTRHANGARAILEIVGVVENPEALEPAYRRVFGEQAVHLQSGRLTVAVGGPTRLVLTRHESLAEVMPQAVGRERPTQRLAGLTVGVRDLEATRGALQASGVRAESSASAVMVDAQSANGVALSFREMPEA